MERPSLQRSGTNQSAMTTISIALATFNGERFLRAQLQSLSQQSRHPDELVIVDDGSTDGTRGILDVFAKQAPILVRIYANKSRLGWRANFLRATELCRGDVIFFCDQDDIWYPRKLQVIEPLFAEPDLLLVHHEADLIDEAGQAYARLRDRENDRERLARLSKPTIWSHAPGLTIAFRRSLLAFLPYWPGSVDPGAPDMPAAHDQWIYHLASNLGVVRYVAEPLVGYRQHGANQIGFRSKRNHAFSSPKVLKSEILTHARMISRFAEALEKALADGRTGFDFQLPAAIEANRALARRLALRSTLYLERHAASRLAMLLRLIGTGSYARSTTWNLGRRSLLADLRAVVRQPH